MALALRGRAVALDAAGETSTPLVIVGGIIIDGTGRPPLPDGVIVIRNGQFVSVTSVGTGSLQADAPRIDAGGKWIRLCAAVVSSPGASREARARRERDYQPGLDGQRRHAPRLVHVADLARGLGGSSRRDGRGRPRPRGSSGAGGGR